MNTLTGLLAQATASTTAAPTESIGDKADQVGKLLEVAKAWVTTQGLSFVIMVASAIAVFMIGKWIANKLTGVAKNLMLKAKLDQALALFLSNLLNMALIVFVAMAALGQLGINTTSFAAVIAAAGLAVGFALQGSLSNFASGVMLIMFRPIAVGDLVGAGGSTGVVQKIEIFNTTLLTPDNVTIIVANSAITSATITNFTAQPHRRIEMVIGCAYGDDIKVAQQTLLKIMEDCEQVLADPAPSVSINGLGDSSVNFNVRPFVKPADYWTVYHYVHEQAYLRWDAAGLNFPYPTQDVNITSMPAKP